MIPLASEISATFLKVLFGSDDDNSGLSGFRVKDIVRLEKLIQAACRCGKCGGALSLQERQMSGMAPELCLTCKSSLPETSETMSDRYGRYYEVNRQYLLQEQLV